MESGGSFASAHMGHFLLDAGLALHLAAEVELAVAAGGEHSLFAPHEIATLFADLSAAVALVAGHVLSFALRALAPEGAIRADGAVARHTVVGRIVQVHEFHLGHHPETLVQCQFTALDVELCRPLVGSFQVVAHITELANFVPTGFCGASATDAVTLAHLHHGLLDGL